jgi:hypothetical protein
MMQGIKDTELGFPHGIQGVQHVWNTVVCFRNIFYSSPYLATFGNEIVVGSIRTASRQPQISVAVLVTHARSSFPGGRPWVELPRFLVRSFCSSFDMQLSFSFHLSGVESAGPDERHTRDR